LHVLDPDGFELDFYDTYDSESGGTFQHDDIPGDEVATWQETVHFPLDGSAPPGQYEFWAYNNHEDPDPAKQYKIYVYEGDQLKDDFCGTVENGAETPHYFYTY
jgi:hypothetical protein